MNGLCKNTPARQPLIPNRIATVNGFVEDERMFHSCTTGMAEIWSGAGRKSQLAQNLSQCAK